jgi:small neutral amino acid transporter SnatA (MarC family)
MADPKLFDFRHLVKSRDHKVIGVVSLFIGAFIGRTILQFTSAGGTLGVGTGIRILIAFWWLFVPAKAPKQQTEAKGDKPGGKEAA